MPDRLPDELAGALDASRDRRGAFGARLEYYADAGSTNDLAAALADAGAPEGTAVVASAQSRGRGRLGRRWFSPPGAGLYVSVVVRRSGLAPLLTLAGGVAVAEGIRRATALPVELKWPNDVIVPGPRGSRRKLAGILAEASSSRAQLQYVVLGYGINLRTAAYPPEVSGRATSIEAELGRPAGAGSTIWEFPPSTIGRRRWRLPVAGGGYFRLLPYSVTCRALRHLNEVEQQPGMVYLHPWEMDPGQPRLPIGRLAQLRHSLNTSRTEDKLRRLLSDFRFQPVRDVLAASSHRAEGVLS